MSVLLSHTDNGVTTVTLNRPDKMNALPCELRQAIAAEFIRLASDDSTQVIILTGAGSKAFSVGLDLKELGAAGLVDDRVQGLDLHQAIQQVGKPIIGAINGYAVTGGFEIALMCDILIAAENVQFADTHVRVGVVPGWGLSQRLSKLIGASRAKELHYTGNFLDAKTAERWGLVNRVVSADDLMLHCMKLAQDIQSADQEVLNSVQHLVNFSLDNGLTEGLAEERKCACEHNRSLTA